jgi:hypothetical protein
VDGAKKFLTHQTRYSIIGHMKKQPAKKRIRAESRADMIATSVALDRELHRRLAIAAIEERTVMTEMMRQAIREWLDRREKRLKGRAG